MKFYCKKNLESELICYLFFYGDLPKDLDKNLAEELKSKDFGKEDFDNLILYSNKKILVLSLGKKEKFCLEKLRRASYFIVKRAKETKSKSLFVKIPEIENIEEGYYAVVEGLLLSDYSFDMKTQKDKFIIEDVYFDFKLNDNKLEELQKVSNAVKNARDLVNLPANIATPQKLVEEAEKVAKENNLKITIFGREDLKKLGMNGILAVGQGSINEPKMVVLEYNPQKSKKKIAFIGKGLCFDAGGLQIKNSDGMQDMKSDKAGACLAIALARLIAEVKIQDISLICAFAAVENLPSSSSYKPRDIIKSYSGKTIEVMHTDAEGRIVLADVIAYIEKKYEPDLIIDAATLTGACHIALGNEAAAILGTAKKEIELMKNIGETIGERVWELPMYEDYERSIKSDVADISNIAKPGTGAGTIIGAIFIKNFVSKPWIHLDIANVSFINEQKYYVPKYATGFGVRLIYNFLRKISQ